MKNSARKLFANMGFGWICVNCDEEQPADKSSRLLNEGEAESKNPRLSSRSLAGWASENRKNLICPICKRSDTL